MIVRKTICGVTREVVVDLPRTENNWQDYLELLRYLEADILRELRGE